MMTSLPRSVRTSSIHFDVCWKELASARGKGEFWTTAERGKPNVATMHEDVKLEGI